MGFNQGMPSCGDSKLIWCDLPCAFWRLCHQSILKDYFVKSKPDGISDNRDESFEHFAPLLLWKNDYDPEAEVFILPLSSPWRIDNICAVCTQLLEISLGLTCNSQGRWHYLEFQLLLQAVLVSCKLIPLNWKSWYMCGGDATVLIVHDFA